MRLTGLKRRTESVNGTIRESAINYHLSFLSSIGPADLKKVLRTLGFKVTKDEATQLIHDVNLKGKG